MVSKTYDAVNDWVKITLSDTYELPEVGNDFYYNNKYSKFYSSMPAINYTSMADSDAGIEAIDNIRVINQTVGVDSTGSFVAGLDNVVTGDYSFVAGKYNDHDVSNLFEIGAGLDDLNRSNALEVADNGSIRAPLQEANNLILLDDHVITKGYADTNYKTGVSGSFTTVDGKTITIVDGMVTAIV